MEIGVGSGDTVAVGVAVFRTVGSGWGARRAASSAKVCASCLVCRISRVNMIAEKIKTIANTDATIRNSLFLFFFVFIVLSSRWLPFLSESFRRCRTGSRVQITKAVCWASVHAMPIHPV